MLNVEQARKIRELAIEHNYSELDEYLKQIYMEQSLQGDKMVCMEECCNEMGKRIEDETIEKRVGYYYIRGKPEFVDDGDDYWDDMTGSAEIHYCPFCGKKLSA